MHWEIACYEQAQRERHILHRAFRSLNETSCFVSQGEKTRGELLNDIIARSKERKLEKARGKEEQESERERLDEGMGELRSMLNQRPTKGVGSAATGQSDDYDLTMRVRGKPQRPW